MAARTGWLAGLLLVAPLAGCGNGGSPAVGADGAPARPPSAEAPASPGRWEAVVLVDTSSRLSGVAIGDVLPDRPGNEVVAVGTDHRMHLVWREGEAWHDEVIATTKGEMIQVAVGDLDRTLPGDEVVAVGVASGNEDDPGARGAAVLVRRVDGAWTVSTLLQDSALCHGVCLDGAVTWVAGYGRRVYRLVGARGEGATSANTPGPGRSVARALGGVVIACRDGAVLRVAEEAGGALAVDLLHRREQGRARIAAAGDDLLVADDDGTLSLLGRAGAEVVWKGEAALRGAVLDDLDPAAPGLEAATASYDGTMRVFARRAAGWAGAIVARDSDRFHHLVAGVLPGWEGPVLLGANYSGRLTVAWKSR